MMHAPTGLLLRSVALRYQPRRRPVWAPRRRSGLSGGSHCGRTAVAAAPTSGRRDHALQMVEAVLFLANEPVASRRLGQLAGLEDATEARTAVRRLNDLYQQQGSAFRVEEVAGGFQMLTHPRFSGWLRRLHPAQPLVRLSAPAMETLAVVAYRQPVLRAEVESIRGVQCGEMLRQLMERDLVRIVGRSPELGRPFLYGTTRLFLQLFGLRELDDLPRAAILRGVEGAAIDEEANPGACRAMEYQERSHDPHEEPEVTISAHTELDLEELTLPGVAATVLDERAHAKSKDEDEDVEDEEEDWDDDEEDEEDEDDDVDEDLDDEDEWEEVDDEDEDWDEEDEEDDDWDDDDDDEEEDWEEEEE